MSLDAEALAEIREAAVGVISAEIELIDTIGRIREAGATMTDVRETLAMILGAIIAALEEPA